MDTLDPFLIDQELRAAAAKWLRWRRHLRQGAGDFALPSLSTRLGKELYTSILQLPEEFPLRAPMARWVYRLAEQRVHGDWLAREAELWRTEEHSVREPVEGRFTLRAMTRAALAGRHVVEWHAARFAALPSLANHRAALWQKRQEFAERMGLSTPDDVELPSSAIYEQAERYLSETQEVIFSRVAPGWVAFVESALARPASEGWPARLSPDTLARLLGHEDWLRSLDIELAPLPERLAPASFLRALARLGAAWSVALTPRDRPFVLARDPGGLAEASHGALFALIACRAPFLRKQLGLSAARAAEYERVLVLAVGQWARLLALRCVLRRSVLAGGAAWLEQSQELPLRVLREEVKPGLILGATRLRLDDPQRLAGWFLAASRFEQLINSYDEDWYRSPRAVEQLREEAKLLQPTHTGLEPLEQGRRSLQTLLQTVVS